MKLSERCKVCDGYFSHEGSLPDAIALYGLWSLGHDHDGPLKQWVVREKKKPGRKPKSKPKEEVVELDG